MLGLYISIAAVLILAILFLIFRIQTFIDIVRGASNRRVGTSNKVNAFLLLAFFVVSTALFIWYSVPASKFFLPKAVSEHGVRTDQMFWITMTILIIAFIGTNIFLFSFVFKYQFKEDRKAYFYPDNHKLEIVWTVIPAIVMAILVYFGWKEWSAITRPAPENAEVVEIMGKQFAWQVRYPGKDKKFGGYNYKLIDATNEMGMNLDDPYTKDDFLPSEIHIPKGQPVLLKIRARDVIHSVFAPHFRLKMDAVPGLPTKFWFTPTKTTQEMRDELGNPKFNYEIACTEVCGRGHFAMRYVIVVEEPEEYEAWYAAQKPWSESNLEYILTKVDEKSRGLYPAAPAPSSAPKADTTSTSASAPADSVSNN